MLLAESVILATTSPLLGTSVQREDTFLGLLSATNVAGCMNTTKRQTEDKTNKPTTTFSKLFLELLCVT